MNTILKIARQSRKEMELFASRVEDGPAAGCPEYLDCFCAIATDLFVRVSRILGFEVDFVEGWFGEDDHPNHCWPQYQGKIIDLTATQFGKEEKVYVVDVGNGEYRYASWNEEAYAALKKDWPEDQAPFAYSDEIATMTRNVLTTVTA